MVVATVRERLAMSKQTTHRVRMEWFNLKILNEVEGKTQFKYLGATVRNQNLIQEEIKT
jgi:hypothetical protein